MNYDVFVCHASEDQESVATPLATQLRSHGLRVWLDQFELTVEEASLLGAKMILVRTVF